MKNTQDILTRLGIPSKNHFMPFYWQKGNHHDKIVEQIDRIQASGVSAFCLESRTHEDFAGPNWWYDLDLILSEAEKRGMEVWILDDKHFPSGYCNGVLEKNGRNDLRRWSVIEAHVDVVGPAPETTLLVPRNNGEELLGACAFPRTQYAEVFEQAPIDLTDKISGNFLQWDIPAGTWRVFFTFKSRAGYLGRNAYFTDLLNPEAVDLFLATCYEPHYTHYARYFGKTLRGFFSDEPSFANDWAGRFKTTDYGFYGRRAGQPGMALPWNDSFRDGFRQQFGDDWATRLPALWYTCDRETTRLTRYTYMDQLTRRYRDTFVRRVGDWCRSHGIEYIGHVIEDQNVHARTGAGTGHYFRAEDGQDMSGMDIVLHQAMPDLGRFQHSASCSSGFVDGDFFHSVLPKMCASAAQLDARTKGRAMCEVFGAFGWAEGVPFMKWMMDLLLVRGINHFVPHAFSPAFPDNDCPPHFGAEGHDPQFAAFHDLMVYANDTASILEGAEHVVDVAILYHAESEWGSLSDSERMLMQIPADALMHAHIDFDIVPIDAVMEAQPNGTGLSFRGKTYQILLIPGTAFLPVNFICKINDLATKGQNIHFIDMKPCPADNMPAEPMSAILSAVPRDITFSGHADEIVHYHVRRGNLDILMLNNESMLKTQDFTISAPWFSRYQHVLSLDICQDRIHSCPVTEKLSITLRPNESRFLIFGSDFIAPQEFKTKDSQTITPHYALSLASYDNLEAFTPYGEFDEFINVTALSRKPDFSGLMRYQFKLQLQAGKHYELDLGEVGSVASLAVNGKFLGWRYCQPYRFELDDCFTDGENDVEIIVANTLANAVKDHFSRFMQIPRSGLFGPLTLHW